MAWVRSLRKTQNSSSPPPTTHKLTSRLAALLAERELSRIELSRLSEIPYPVVRRLLRPEADPSLEQALRICRALAVEVEEIFALEPQPMSFDRRWRATHRRAGRE